MLGILSLALLGAAAPPHTCESLAAARLPQATITSAVVVPAGPFVPARRRPGPTGRRTRSCRTHSRALSREDGAQADAGLQYQRRALDADGELERTIPRASATAASPDRFRATATCRSRCGVGYATAGDRHRALRGRWPRRDVRRSVTRRRSSTSRIAPCTR